jgi:hypothetical protein
MISTDYFGIFNYKRCKTSKTNTNKKTQHNYIYEILKYSTVVLFLVFARNDPNIFYKSCRKSIPTKTSIKFE